MLYNTRVFRTLDYSYYKRMVTLLMACAKRVKGLKVGMRFPSAQVIRFCDAFELQFLKAFPSDGRWRIVIFAGNVRQIAASRRLDSGN